eukprot:CAMPEP_0114226704 /NCGR_PEP_ID=MMETSP0058-20121206/1379_1 /TAXON_ID=36894 /ORGANISM="Pyramimonas parkeae, CCMP726" /LENGTH=41 /DNA_ID= /DNA_START= /DNA_END= /DNA_ORIENTATION=
MTVVGLSMTSHAGTISSSYAVNQQSVDAPALKYKRPQLILE